MVLTPLMVIAHDRLAPKPVASEDGVEGPEGLSGRALLIGFGRVGQIVSQPLLTRGHALSIIDSDAEAIRDASDFGFKVWYGDGTRLDILHAAGAAHAAVIIVAPDNREAASKIVALVKHEFPLVPVLARAFDRAHAVELLAAGAEVQVRETFESAMVLGREALLALGETPDQADEIMAAARARDAERLVLDQAEGFRAGASLIIGNKDLPAGH